MIGSTGGERGGRRESPWDRSVSEAGGGGTGDT